MEIVLQKPKGKKDLIGLAIVTAGKMATGEAKYCHIGIKIGPRVYESLLSGGVSSRDYKCSYKNLPHDVIEVPRVMMPLYNETRAYEYIESLIGQFKGLYGIGKIPLQALDSIASFVAKRRVFFFTKTFGVKSFPICSSLVGKILHKFGNEPLKILFDDWEALSPDDIADRLECIAD